MQGGDVMVELWINDQKCVLKSGFSWKIRKTNVFTNEECDHTLDIDIDMHDSVNARIFKFVHREDTDKQLPDMIAVIREGNKVRLEGNVFLLSITDNILKIQIVGEGNSFSYKSEGTDIEEGSRRINALELGTIQDTVITDDDATHSLNSHYPDCNYVCVPTLMDYTRKCRLNTNGANSVWEGIENCCNPENPSAWLTKKTKIGHPYLLLIVERVCKALGYTMQRNDLLQDEQALREFVVIRSTSLNLADHLPAWTVTKFFREIEKKYNVLCTFNKINKTLTIESYKNQVESGVTYLETALDEKEYEYEEEAENQERSFVNVKYNFPEGYSFYNEADLGSDIEKQCETRFIENVDSCADYDSRVISRYQGVDMVRRRENTSDAAAGYREYIAPVNIYRHRGDDKSDDLIDLNIVPCIYTMGMGVFCTTPSGDYIRNAYIVPVVVPCEFTQSQSARSSQGMNDMIDNGVQEEEEPDDSPQLCVAVYNGIQQQTFKYSTYTHFFSYPEIAVPAMIDILGEDPLRGARVLMKKEQKYSLALDDISNHYYSMKGVVDMRTKYKKKFICSDMQTPAGLYCIKNRMYFCNSIEYTLTEKGLDKVAEGEFYSILEDV